MGKLVKTIPGADLVAKINSAHRSACGNAQKVFEYSDKSMEYAAECGRLLIKAKEAVPRGEWLPWIEAHLDFGERQAQKYARTAKNWEAIQAAKAKCEPGSYFGSINGALRLIAKPQPAPVIEDEDEDDEPELNGKPSRKPKPGEVIVIHHDDEGEPDDDEGDEVGRRFRGLDKCCSQGWNSADDALHHIEWLHKHSTIDHATLEAVSDAYQAWGRVHRMLREKQTSTLPQDGRSDVAVGDIGDIPPELDRRRTQ
jgi:hypothetical protein